MRAQIIVLISAVFPYWLMSPEGFSGWNGETAASENYRQQYLQSECSVTFSQAHNFESAEAAQMEYAMPNRCGAKSPHCNMGRMPRHIFVSRAVCVLWRTRPTWTNANKRDVELHSQPAGQDVGCGMGSTFRGTIADDRNGNVNLCSVQQISGATEMKCQLALLSELRTLLTQVHSDNIHVVPKSWKILSYRSSGIPVQVHLTCVAKSGGNIQTCWLNAMGSISDAGLHNTSDQARQLSRPCLRVNGRCIWTGNPRYWSANRCEELEMHDPNATGCHCRTERIFLGRSS